MKNWPVEPPGLAAAGEFRFHHHPALARVHLAVVEGELGIVAGTVAGGLPRWANNSWPSPGLVSLAIAATRREVCRAFGGDLRLFEQRGGLVFGLKGRGHREREVATLRGGHLMGDLHRRGRVGLSKGRDDGLGGGVVVVRLRFAGRGSHF